MSDRIHSIERNTDAPNLSSALLPLQAVTQRIGRESTLAGASAEILDVLIAATSATRASLLLVNPATGLLRMHAALGLAREYVGQDVPPRPRSISDWVMRQRRGLILNGEIRDQRFTGVETGRAIESAMSLPLVTAHGPIGVLNLARTAPAPVFADGDLAAVERELCVAAETLERLLRLEIADGMALPDGPPPGGTLVAPGAQESRDYTLGMARVRAHGPGADLVERVAHSDGSFDLLFADMTGAYGDAAHAAAFAQGLFVAGAAPGRAPVVLAARLDAELRQRLHGRAAAGIWLAHIGRNGEITSCAAGAMPPFWVPSDGSAIHRLESGGPRCGGQMPGDYAEENVRMLPGDVLVVVSDGVLEARDGAGRRFGEYVLAELLDESRHVPVERLVERILDAALAHVGRGRPAEELVALALRFRPSR
ncbi:MAG TPA: GAF domain-containing SpoIIE family protein phosphatase [Candidatus Saccharimonadaceae bacterium]|nr:GAF domain-containing SpoIIE family protein phosphatase [Candidatus Saccharimonadaceae bacterium]